jgi:hypothetical protein
MLLTETAASLCEAAFCSTALDPRIAGYCSYSPAAVGCSKDRKEGLMVQIAKVGTKMILSGPGTGLQGRRKNAVIAPENTTVRAIERDREIQLSKLLSGQRLLERPFERLTETERGIIAEQAQDFLNWRERNGELHFGR